LKRRVPSGGAEKRSPTRPKTGPNDPRVNRKKAFKGKAGGPIFAFWGSGKRGNRAAKTYRVREEAAWVSRNR